uniref:Uncharacterized protein n=1 Tax=Solanum lycopersicum TaxID=4081 RepID=A0A3Q7G3Q6_SOLLC
MFRSSTTKYETERSRTRRRNEIVLGKFTTNPTKWSYIINNTTFFGFCANLVMFGAFWSLFLELFLCSFGVYFWSFSRAALESIFGAFLVQFWSLFSELILCLLEMFSCCYGDFSLLFLVQFWCSFSAFWWWC